MIIATSCPKKFKIGAELIKWYQNTKYSHVLIIKDNLVFQASHGSVNCQHIDVFKSENQILDNFEIADDLVDFDFVTKQLGKPYGVLQLINITTKFLLHITLFKRDNDSRFICSEFVGKALKLTWVDDFTSPRQIVEYIGSNHSNV